jgi:uncharacterized protein (TIRG00374 family)
MSFNGNDIASPQKEKMKVRSWLWFFLVFIFVFGLVVYYFAGIKKELLLLQKVNPYWLIAAVYGQFMTYFFTALIYLFLLRAYKLPQLPGLWDMLKASIVSLLFNQTVPSAGVSGNTFFFNFLARFNISKKQIISLILAELLIFYAAMELIIVSLLIACMFVYRSFYTFKGTLTAGIIVYLAFGLVIALAGRKNMLNLLYEKVIKIRVIKKILQRISKKISDEPISEKEIQVSALMKKNKPIVVKAFLFQLLVVAADSFTLYVLFLGIGYPVSAFIVLLTLISTKIISILPFLPGSLVLYESSMSFLFASAGVPVGTAIVVTLVYRLLSFWFPMLPGTLFYRKWLKGSREVKAIS